MLQWHSLEKLFLPKKSNDLVMRGQIICSKCFIESNNKPLPKA
jgi:hypothetical protein